MMAPSCSELCTRLVALADAAIAALEANDDRFHTHAFERERLYDQLLAALPSEGAGVELATHLRAVLQADERLEQATRRALERARGELSQMADGRRALHAYRGWSGPRISRFVDAER